MNTQQQPNNTPDARLTDNFQQNSDQQNALAEHDNTENVKRFMSETESYRQAQAQNPSQAAVAKPEPPLMRHVVVTNNNPLTMTVTMIPFVPPPDPSVAVEGQLGPGDSPIGDFWKLSMGSTGKIVHWYYSKPDVRGGASHYREGDKFGDYTHHVWPNPFAPDHLFHAWESST